MILAKRFKEVVYYLKEQKIQFALTGGLLASVYRSEARATMDLDFAIYAEGAQAIAEKTIIRFGLTPHPLRKAELEGGPMFAIKKKSTPICILAGRSADKTEIGIDFLLPEIPWVKRAIERAQNNLIEFGFGPVPCLTVEDLIIAKLYELKGQSTRFMDLDDLKSIFIAELEMDQAYLIGRMKEFDIKLPAVLKDVAPKVLT